jgi:hypothetical protein
MDRRFDMKWPLGLLAAGILLAVPGRADTAAEGAWRWEAWPSASRLLIAQLPASVVPIRAELVRAPVAGRLRLLAAARSQGALAAGTAWAAIVPESPPGEAKEIAREEADLASRRARYKSVDLPAVLEKLDSALDAERETLAMARLAERSPGLFEGTTPVLDPRLRPSSTSAEIEVRLRALEARRREAAALDPSADPPDLQGIASSLELHRRELAAKTAERGVEAPISGTLRLAVSPESDGLWVEAGSVLATIEDDSALEVVVPGTLPLLHGVPAGSLFCTVAVSGAPEASADFSSWGVDPSSPGAKPLLRFRLPAGAFEGRRSDLAGIEVPALVYTRLPEPARIVPKLALAERDPAGYLAAGWSEGLVRLFPGSRVLAEGRSAVAIVPRQ